MKKQMKKIAACAVVACMAVSAVGFAAPDTDGKNLSPVQFYSARMPQRQILRHQNMYFCLSAMV